MILSTRTAPGRLRLLGASLLALGTLLAGPARAVPSYARQTGADCGACHIGAFGPQLTPYGMAFKLGGYVDSDGKDGKVPLSGMLVGNFTRTAKDATEAPEHFKTNDNTALQEASVFLAGRMTDHLGAFVQSTYSGVDRKWAFDQLDLRYARTAQVADRETTWGLSLNSNPTLTDPLNTLGQWRFPYTESDFGAGFGPSPIVENLASSVLGLNGYALWGKNVYAEFGLYDTLSHRGLRMFNADDAGRFTHLAPYWRLAWLVDRKRDNFSLGVFGFNASLQPDRTVTNAGSDRYADLGIDASYQYLGNRSNIVTVNGSWVHERQKLGYSVGADAAANARNSLDTARVAVSYHQAQTWGLTGALFRSSGSTDTTLYGGSLNGKPTTAGYMLQADWTPWGKENSWGAPWANVRLGLQYTGYTSFNGGSRYIDEASSASRRARDNNTTMLFAWIAY